MSTGYQIEDQFATYFITVTVIDWVDVFSRQHYRDIIIDSLKYCIEKKELRVYGYVIISNHLHLIVRSSNGTLSGTIRDFKRFTAISIIKAIKDLPESRREWMLHRFEWSAAQNVRNSDHQFWIQDNRPEILISEKFFLQKLNYIHYNPVSAGLVDEPEHYIYSSAKTILKDKQGLLPVELW